MTNSLLRERFGIEKENSAMISRVIRDSIEDGVIKPINPENKSRRMARYWPSWAWFYLTVIDSEVLSK